MEILKNATFVRNLAISLVLVLTSSAAFGLGRLSVLMTEKEPISIENFSSGVFDGSSTLPISLATTSTSRGGGQTTTPKKAAVLTPPALPKPVQSVETIPPKLSSPSSSTNSEKAGLVASKTGKSYYFPWCGIVKRIKPENRITFNSKAEAAKAGYKPGNCAGLQ